MRVGCRADSLVLESLKPTKYAHGKKRTAKAFSFFFRQFLGAILTPITIKETKKRGTRCFFLGGGGGRRGLLSTICCRSTTSPSPPPTSISGRNSAWHSREHSVVTEGITVTEILEPLGSLHVANVRPLVVLARPAVELEEVRHRALQELRLEAVSGVVHHHDPRAVADDGLLSGGVREDRGVHVASLGAHLWEGRGG